MSDEQIPLPGEWFWGILCPGCHRHCPMYRDITQGIIELTARRSERYLGRIVGVTIADIRMMLPPSSFTTFKFRKTSMTRESFSRLHHARETNRTSSLAFQIQAALPRRTDPAFPSQVIFHL